MLPSNNQDEFEQWSCIFSVQDIDISAKIYAKMFFMTTGHDIQQGH